MSTDTFTDFVAAVRRDAKEFYGIADPMRQELHIDGYLRSFLQSQMLCNKELEEAIKRYTDWLNAESQSRIARHDALSV